MNTYKKLKDENAILKSYLDCVTIALSECPDAIKPSDIIRHLIRLTECCKADLYDASKNS